MANKWIEYFDFLPGQVKKMWCRACGTECEVDRNVMGATCMAEAMGKKKHLHDKFMCPITGIPWHERAVELYSKIRETPSSSERAQYQEDLDHLLRKYNCVFPDPDLEELLENGWEALSIEKKAWLPGLSPDLVKVLLYHRRFYVIASGQDGINVESYPSLMDALEKSDTLAIDETCVSVTSKEKHPDELAVFLNYIGEIETTIKLNDSEYLAKPGGSIIPVKPLKY